MVYLCSVNVNTLVIYRDQTTCVNSEALFHIFGIPPLCVSSLPQHTGHEEMGPYVWNRPVQRASWFAHLDDSLSLSKAENIFQTNAT